MKELVIVFIKYILTSLLQNGIRQNSENSALVSNGSYGILISALPRAVSNLRAETAFLPSPYNL